MAGFRKLQHLVPPFFRPVVKSLVIRMLPPTVKYEHELAFWKYEWEQDGRCFKNDYYKGTMLGMAQEEDDGFLAGKIVADFGCGPRGSLVWAKNARLRIGIDVLTEVYSRFEIRTHDMVYVESSEKQIPLPSGYVDVMFTLNAMDHVVDLDAMCAEIRRVIVPGGTLIGSFNLDEEPTLCEPQTLTEAQVKESLLKHFDIVSYRTAPKGPKGAAYSHFTDNSPPPTSGERFLWVRATKRV
ncbi:MAG: methyltransferase domain-containing protein [Prosthecobacter sp.]|nr:methyltransferase domain-containing protein [Prosthecobacter sp.]